MKITALAGGVGAARLVSGLAAIIPAEDLTVIVNTGDDFDWMGLYVCPDLDTIVYTLAGLADPLSGWGIRNDTFHCLERLKELAGDAWFMIGDRDLATHVFRTLMLREGKTLTEATNTICVKNGIRSHLLPMTDSRVPTLVHTDEGTLAFQDYFVRRKCAPRVMGFTYDKAELSCPAPQLIESLATADAIIVCPSNPYLSIGPVLAVPGIRNALRVTPAKVVAVSPIIAGQAIKGPTAIMLHQMGMDVSATSVATLYRDFIDIFVLDERDRHLTSEVSAYGLEVRTAPTLMSDSEARVELARAVLEMFG